MVGALVFSLQRHICAVWRLFVVLLLALLYWFPLRHRMACWGTLSPELTRVMAGDGLIAKPTFTYTMAITVNARPEHTWPRLMQMGCERGGLYSYHWLDRVFGFLDRPSATRIIPEFQHLSVGDKIPLLHGQGYPVAAIESGRALALDMRNMWGFDWVWQFGLYAVGENRTRLVSRSTLRPLTIWNCLFGVLVMEPAAFIMTRRMLLGLKERAETLRAHGLARAA
jgi:hypothetical protein